MPEKIFGNEYRNTMVFVDSYEDRVLRGRYYNAYLNKAVHFSSTIELISEIEKMLNEMKFPQAFNKLRRFGDDSFDLVEDEEVPEHGKVATFNVRVLFRQNASWQGNVTWIDGKKEESFRSVLELLILMDSAMTPETHD